MSDNPIDASYYETQAAVLAFICRTMYYTDIDLDYLEGSVSYAHAAGPVLEPAAYKEGIGNLRDMERLVRAYKAFRAEVEAVAGGKP